jgi:hypothetical protein
VSPAPLEDDGGVDDDTDEDDIDDDIDDGGGPCHSTL